MGESIPDFIQHWGPSVLLVISLTLLLSATRRKPRYSEPIETRTNQAAPRRATSKEGALEDIRRTSPYNLTDHGGPNIRLGDVSRFTPSDYRASVAAISERFKEGRVISIDLSGLEESEAVRLIDFCSGMLSFSSGWFFRMTKNVIILVPRS
ncbi:cell division protein SepF [Nocardiopsis sp. N85]|uniref:cell division protein SepF n=1 Tax=Nocardiopsis sp. N85 TaxID=3029400 RepID=UPI00406C944E